MARRVSALYLNRTLAEQAAARLDAAGLAGVSAALSVHEQPGDAQPGMFDRLATMLARDAEFRESGYVVSADVMPEQMDAVAVALEAGAERVEISAPPRFGEQVVELSETAEQLVVEKQAVLREEIVMRVQTKERLEEVHDSVRRTEVDIERFGPSGEDASIDLPPPPSR